MLSLIIRCLAIVVDLKHCMNKYIYSVYTVEYILQCICYIYTYSYNVSDQQQSPVNELLMKASLSIYIYQYY